VLSLARQTLAGDISAPGPIPPSLLGSAGRSMVVRAAVWMSNAYASAAEAVSEPNWPAAKGKLPEIPKDDTFVSRLRYPPRSSTMSPVSRVSEVQFRALVKRRMTAVALAVRLWEVGHGRRPESLEQLAPDYLPAVPVDVFAADGRAIGYLPDAEHPMLYSVGPNGVDEGGKFSQGPEWPPDYAHDIPFFLDGGWAVWGPQSQSSQPSTGSGGASYDEN